MGVQKEKLKIAKIQETRGECKEQTSISLLEGFKLKRGFHLALGLALPLIRIHNLATASVIVVVVILIAIIIRATPFPIILSL